MTVHLDPWLFTLMEMTAQFRSYKLPFGCVTTWTDESKKSPEVPPEVIFIEISKPLTNKRWQRNYSLLQNINSRIIMIWIITIIIILHIFKNHLHFNLNDPPINIKIHMFKMWNFKIQINKLIYFDRFSKHVDTMVGFNFYTSIGLKFESNQFWKSPFNSFHGNDFWHFTLIWKPRELANYSSVIYR